MGSIYRRAGSPFLWMRYIDQDRPVRCSTETRDPKEARRLLALREGAVARGEPIAPNANRLLVGQLIDDLLADYRVNRLRSLPDLEGRCRLHLVPWFGEMRATAVTAAHCRRYIEERQAAGAAAATINRELAALRRAFRLAVQAGRLVVAPHIPLLREQNARSGFLEAADLAAVKQRVPEVIGRILDFLYTTGWRVDSEVLPMQWRQVDFVAATIRLDAGTTKSGEPRVFPFTPGLRAVLEAQRAYTTDCERRLGRIIASVWHQEGRPVLDFRRRWRRACRTAGIPGRLLHDFRRSAVRNLELAAVPRAIAMQLTGHRTEAIYRRYAIVSRQDLDTAVERLGALGR